MGNDLRLTTRQQRRMRRLLARVCKRWGHTLDDQKHLRELVAEVVIHVEERDYYRLRLIAERLARRGGCVCAWFQHYHAKACRILDDWGRTRSYAGLVAATPPGHRNRLKFEGSHATATSSS